MRAGVKFCHIVNHLNVGRELIPATKAEREELAEINLQAGRKPITTAAYEAAFKYLHTGVELLSEAAWEQQYDFASSAPIEAAEAADPSGNFLQMEDLTSIVLQQAKASLDKCKAYEVMLHACSARNKPCRGREDRSSGARTLSGSDSLKNPPKRIFYTAWKRQSRPWLGGPSKNFFNLPSNDGPTGSRHDTYSFKRASPFIRSLPQTLPAHCLSHG